MIQDGNLTNQSELQDILDEFPSDISLAFGYGSGVFAQSNHTVKESELPMIDLIFSTSNIKQWHDDNLKHNPDHYAVIPRTLGTGFVEMVNKWGAGVYFNPMVKVGSDRKRLVKYGVIHDETLKRDLREWNTMYIAGRLHKPTLPLYTTNDDEILELQEGYNLKYAMSTALLLLSDKKDQIHRQQIDVTDIFESIASLSYIGDPRFAAGAEDPMKVKKLVHSVGQIDRFQTVYKHQYQSLEKMGIMSVNGSVVEMNLMDISTRKSLYERLPPRLQSEMKYLFDKAAPDLGTDSSPDNIEEISKILTKSIANIVAPPAKIQSMKGLLTAGVLKSAKYASAKLSKGALKGMKW
jgi:translocator assembly and maintenance protein 41